MSSQGPNATSATGYPFSISYIRDSSHWTTYKKQLLVANEKVASPNGYPNPSWLVGGGDRRLDVLMGFYNYNTAPGPPYQTLGGAGNPYLPGQIAGPTPAAVAASAPALLSLRHSYTTPGQTATFTPPADVTSIIVVCVGGGGSGGLDGGFYGGGGGGALAWVRNLAVTSADSFAITVAGISDLSRLAPPYNGDGQDTTFVHIDSKDSLTAGGGQGFGHGISSTTGGVPSATGRFAVNYTGNYGGEGNPYGSGWNMGGAGGGAAGYTGNGGAGAHYTNSGLPGSGGGGGGGSRGNSMSGCGGGVGPNCPGTIPSAPDGGPVAEFGGAGGSGGADGNGKYLGKSIGGNYGGGGGVLNDFAYGAGGAVWIFY